MDQTGLRGQGCQEGGDIRAIPFHGDFLIGDPQIHQRTGRLYGIADDGLHGIIGFSRSTDHFVSRMQVPQEDHSQGMGAGNELRADQGGFRLENIGIDQIQLIPAGIGIAVARGVSGNNPPPGIWRRHPIPFWYWPGRLLHGFWYAGQRCPVLSVRFRPIGWSLGSSSSLFILFGYTFPAGPPAFFSV